MNIIAHNDNITLWFSTNASPLLKNNTITYNSSTIYISTAAAATVAAATIDNNRENV